jgi:hypothetical protein
MEASGKKLMDQGFTNFKNKLEERVFA